MYNVYTFTAPITAAKSATEPITMHVNRFKLFNCLRWNRQNDENDQLVKLLLETCVDVKQRAFRDSNDFSRNQIIAQYKLKLVHSIVL